MATSSQADDKCLRNMSCKCSLCIGEPLDELKSISKSIHSNVAYDNQSFEKENVVEPAVKKNDLPTSSSPAAMTNNNTSNNNDNIIISTPSEESPSVVQSSPPPVMTTTTTTDPLPTVNQQDNAEEPQENDCHFSEEVITVVAEPKEVAKPSQVASSNQDNTVCKRNMSCTCPLCAGEDLSALKSMQMDISNEDQSALKVSSPKEPASTTTTETAIPVKATGTVQERAVDKSWKVRKEAYEDLQHSTNVEDLLKILPLAVKDTNAAALDAGLESLNSALNNDTVCQSLVSDNNDFTAAIISSVIEKGFTSSRPTSIQNSQNILLSLVSLSKASEVVSTLCSNLKAKKPKIPPMCVSTLALAMKSFGPVVIPFATLKGHLSSMCESTVKNVRPNAMTLLVEIYRYTGPTLLSDTISSLRPAQQAEFATLVENVTPGEAVPSMSMKGASKSTKAFGGVIDPRELTEAVALIEKLSKTKFSTLIDSPKWKDKVEALNSILQLIGPVPKLTTNEDYHEVVGILKKLLSNSNINVVAKVVEVFGAMADGLRKNFTAFAKNTYGSLLEKFSDKKTVLLNAVNKTMDIYQEHCLPLDYMMQSITDVCTKAAAPNARVQVITFLQRNVGNSFSSSKIDLASNGTDLAKLGQTLVSDKDPKVRAAALSFFAALLTSCENSSIEASVKGIYNDNIKRSNPRAFSKIEELLKGEASTSSSSEKTSTTVRRKGSVKVAPKAAAAATSNKKKESVVETPTAVLMTEEEAELKLGDLGEAWTNEVVPLLASSKWSERKEGFEKIKELLNDDVASFTEALIVYTGKCTKNFKEANMNVMRPAFEVIALFLNQCSDECLPPKTAIASIIPCVVDKLSDRKMKVTCLHLLNTISECAGPKFTIACVASHMAAIKALTGQLEVLAFLSSCVEDFGIVACGGSRQLCDVLRTKSMALDAVNPKVKSASVSLAGKLYYQVGDALIPAIGLSTMSPSTAATLETEFKKVGHNAEGALGNICKSVRIKPSDDEINDSSSTCSSAAIDIGDKLTPSLFEELSNESDKAAWKVRSGALEAVQRICRNAGMKVDPSSAGLSDLMRVLKMRVCDSNANVKLKAVTIVGVLASSLGSTTASSSQLIKYKGIIPSVLASVGDGKTSMRLAVVETLRQWVSHDNEVVTSCMDSILPAISVALIKSNSAGRLELLNWCVKYLPASSKSCDVQCLLKATIECLQDRSSENREVTTKLLSIIAPTLGEGAVRDALRDCKPAVIRTLSPVLDKVLREASLPNEAPPETAASVQPPPAPVTVVASTTTTTKKPLMSSRRASKGAASGSTRVKEEEKNNKLLIPNADKNSRNEKGRTSNWLFEDPKDIKSLSEMLQSQWTPLVSPNLASKLFAPSYEKGLTEAIVLLSKCVTETQDDVIQSLDFIFKWASFRIVDNNVQGLGKMLDLMVTLFEMLQKNSYVLHDTEATIILPYLLQECGHSKPRFRVKFRQVLHLVLDIYKVSKYVPFILEKLFSVKNNRTRCECLDVMALIVRTNGYQVATKKGLRDIASYVNASEKEVRESAISCLMDVFRKCKDEEQFFKLINASLNQKSKDLLSARLARIVPVPVKEEGLKSITEEVKKEAVPISVNVMMTATPAAAVKEDEPPLLSPTVELENEGEEGSSLSPMLKIGLSHLNNMILDERRLQLVSQDSEEFVEGKNSLKRIFAMAESPNVKYHGVLRENATALFTALYKLLRVMSQNELNVRMLSLTLATIKQTIVLPRMIQRFQRNNSMIVLGELILALCQGLCNPKLQDDDNSLSSGMTERLIFALNDTLKHVTKESSTTLMAILSIAEKVRNDNDKKIQNILKKVLQRINKSNDMMMDYKEVAVTLNEFSTRNFPEWLCDFFSSVKTELEKQEASMSSEVKEILKIRYNYTFNTSSSLGPLTQAKIEDIKQTAAAEESSIVQQEDLQPPAEELTTAVPKPEAETVKEKTTSSLTSIETLKARLSKFRLSHSS